MSFALLTFAWVTSAGCYGRSSASTSKLQPTECKNLNGGVVTAEACCTDPHCQVRPACAGGALAHVVLTNQERLGLWRRAKVLRVTRALP